MRRHIVAVAIFAAVLLHGGDGARAAVRRTHRSTATTTPAPATPPITITVPGAAAGAPATTSLHPDHRRLCTSPWPTPARPTASTSRSARSMRCCTRMAASRPARRRVPRWVAARARGWASATQWWISSPVRRSTCPSACRCRRKPAGGDTAAVIRAVVTRASPTNTRPRRRTSRSTDSRPRSASASTSRRRFAPS